MSFRTHNTWQSTTVHSTMLTPRLLALVPYFIASGIQNSLTSKKKSFIRSQKKTAPVSPKDPLHDFVNWYSKAVWFCVVGSFIAKKVKHATSRN